MTQLMKMVMESLQSKNSVKLYSKLFTILTKKKKQLRRRKSNEENFKDNIDEINRYVV